MCLYTMHVQINNLDTVLNIHHVVVVFLLLLPFYHNNPKLFDIQ